MEIEITKTENGYHCKDKSDDEEWCFETAESMLGYIRTYLPKEIGNEIKLTG